MAFARIEKDGSVKMFNNLGQGSYVIRPHVPAASVAFRGEDTYVTRRDGRTVVYNKLGQSKNIF